MSEAAYILEFTVNRAAHTVTPEQPQAAGVSGDHRAATVRFILTDPPADRLYRVEVCDGGGGYDVTDLLTPENGAVTCEIPSHWTAAGIAALRLVEYATEQGEVRQVYHYPPVRLQFEARQDGTAVVATPVWQTVVTEAHLNASAAKEIAEQTQAQCLRPNDYASKALGGTVRVDAWFGIGNYSGDGVLKIIPATQAEIDARAQYWHPIVPANLLYAVRSVGDTCYAPLSLLDEVQRAADAILAIQEELIGGGS